MNILKRELRAGLKPFILWTVGLFILVFIGIYKFEGVSAGGVDVTGLLNQFPRPVLAVMGLAGVDIATLGGYASVLFYYVLICAVIYSVHLGSSAVTRESVDKTYEFVFTKPVSRDRVLAMKLLAGWIFLLFFSVLNMIFSFIAVSTLNASETITGPIVLFALSIFLIASLFIALSAFLAALVKQADKGSLYGNLAFLYAFILGVVYDMLENGGLLRLISPFKYFRAPDLLDLRFDPLYTVISLALTAAFLFGAFRLFRRRDLI
jgi:ABC-2 type transport system permease protein